MTSAPHNLTSELAVRLGYEAEDRLLIVNCDDLGSSHNSNVATLRALSEGVATSASLMVPCPWAWEAAGMLEGLPVGVHLTLTSEYRSYGWRSLTGGASLRDRDGFLHASATLALDKVAASEVLAECRSQIETALAWGIDVTHLDVHMDVLFSRSDLFATYLDLAEEFQLPVRLPPRATTAKQDFKTRQIARERGLLSSENLIYPWPRPTRDVFFEYVPKLPPGVSEVFAHPVDDGQELRAYDPDYADIRAHDDGSSVKRYTEQSRVSGTTFRTSPTRSGRYSATCARRSKRPSSLIMMAATRGRSLPGALSSMSARGGRPSMSTRLRWLYRSTSGRFCRSNRSRSLAGQNTAVSTEIELRLSRGGFLGDYGE